MNVAEPGYIIYIFNMFMLTVYAYIERNRNIKIHTKHNRGVPYQYKQL